MSEYLFVIDTEEYSGNFEREMCAFITGHIGECGVGQDKAILYRKQTRKEALEFIQSKPDDHGCNRPVRIYPTPGWFNHGYGGHFRDGQEKKALVAMKKYVVKDCGEHIKQVKVNTWSDAEKRREIANTEKKINDAIEQKEVNKFPSYQSVCIFCSRRPTDNEIKFMKKRAMKFRKGLAKGFRLIEEKIVSNSISI